MNLVQRHWDAVELTLGATVLIAAILRLWG